MVIASAYLDRESHQLSRVNMRHNSFMSVSPCVTEDNQTFKGTCCIERTFALFCLSLKLRTFGQNQYQTFFVLKSLDDLKHSNLNALKHMERNSKPWLNCCFHVEPVSCVLWSCKWENWCLFFFTLSLHEMTLMPSYVNRIRSGVELLYFHSFKIISYFDFIWSFQNWFWHCQFEQ